ncbi:hypothetical protein AgCh_009438 [Apium graveolens]
MFYRSHKNKRKLNPLVSKKRCPGLSCWGLSVVSSRHIQRSAGQVNGSGHTQFLKVRPILAPDLSATSTAFLPKGAPFPPSGPSLRHNSFGGLKSWLKKSP